MSRYLNPRADLTFKRVFGEHKNLLISFLNAMLPLEDGEEIREIEYLPNELVPEIPLRKKYSIVDVRCTDNHGRVFIVEMQMEWRPEFMQRMLLNASKAYVNQTEPGEEYDELNPVYALALLNENYEEGDDYYHHYTIVEDAHTERVLKGLEFVFVELRKFHPDKYSAKKMHILWMRFLTEINERTDTPNSDLLENDDIRSAIKILERSAYTDAQMRTYDYFWDSVSIERTWESYSRKQEAKGRAEGLAEGRAEGLAEGEAKGRAEGEAKGRADRDSELVSIMRSQGYSEEQIAALFGGSAG